MQLAKPLPFSMVLPRAESGLFAPLPARRYSLIYADPNWSFKTYSDKGKDRAPDQHYECLSTEQLGWLDVASIAEDDAALLMWVYQPMLPDALQLIEAWGFEFKTVAYYWFKVNGGQGRLFYGDADIKKGLGYYTRAGCEQCWLATRGKPLTRDSKSEGQVIFAPRRQHSRKPDEVAESIVNMFGDVSRIELFARTKRLGWDHYGNETQKFSEAI
jgi:N6-adenosine-specific RNA methylase IME4